MVAGYYQAFWRLRRYAYGPPYGNPYRARVLPPSRGEADQVTAQFIRGMYISGHQLVVDNLAALSANLGTGRNVSYRRKRRANSHDIGCVRGLVTYDTDDNFDTTNGSGTYQVWISTLDGKLYAGGGALIIDSTGLRLQANVGGAVEALKWYDSDTLISQISQVLILVVQRHFRSTEEPLILRNSRRQASVRDSSTSMAPLT